MSKDPFWSAYKLAKKGEQEARREENLRVFLRSPTLARTRVVHRDVEDTVYVYSDLGTMKYFLGKDQWRYKGTNYYGDYKRFNEWLKLKLDKA